MKKQFNRRDFLKLAGVLPLGMAAPQWLRTLDARSLQGRPKNVIVVVFDAFSAYNISLYGYARQTTPNIARLAKRAVVYHNHYAGGNYTTPGTATLLTGVLPWTHRALNFNAKVVEPYDTKNIFGAFQNYHRIAYSHNGFANTFLRQFQNQMEEYIPRETFYLDSYDTYISSLFENDDDIASVSWIRNIKINEEGFAYSLFLSHLYESLQDRKIKNLKPRFPRGLPTVNAIHPYMLETAIDAIRERLPEVPQPFFGYFHFMPPHAPYRTPRDFVDTFNGDGFKPIEKPVDPILAWRINAGLPRRRTQYDEFILYSDREFGRLYNTLEASGLLENSWLVLTSDHGEMFERGIGGHGSKPLYQPVVRVPLMIFEPGRETGMDIYEYTSAVDLLPTLTHLTGQKLPDWSEGVVLPPYANTGQSLHRSIYVVQAEDNSPDASLTQASTVLVRENYKLHYYFGYSQLPEGELVKLFDIEADPEEMVDLYASKKETAAELLNELKAKLKEVNEPYL